MSGSTKTASELSDREARRAVEVAEEAREEEWKHPSFAAGVFLGTFDPSALIPFPEQPEEDRRIGEAFAQEIERFLVEHLDPDRADREGRLPEEVVRGLIDLGAFALKIPEEYGGKGFSQANYNRVVGRVASYCASTAVWLSAHQSIGVPTPLKMFGTKEQKERFLPRLAQGELSAFALTEPGVGSDPARMETVAVRAPDGDGWILNGEKLWTSNGPVARLLVVMARTPEEGSDRIRHTAFVVDTTWPGVRVAHRCEFMGLRAIENGVLRFENVRVPDENVLWGVGKGLKLALITLNTGRLTLPACCSAVARLAVAVSRRWAQERRQWGAPIGRHEAIADKLARMAADSYAMDAITDFATALVDRGDADVRIEAAMAKLFCSEALWRILDDTVQIRGGRGYETARSLAARGETPWPVERMLRDARINTIVEGTSEIMRLFLAREALDPHLRRAGDLFKPGVSLHRRLKVFAAAAAHYPLFVARTYLPGGRPLPEGLPPALRRHLAWVRSASKRLARRTFFQMVRHGPSLERRQLQLHRIVDIGVDLTVTAAACARAAGEAERQPASVELADLFARRARRRVERRFAELNRNDDEAARHVARGLLEGRYAFREYGYIDPLARPPETAGGGEAD